MIAPAVLFLLSLAGVCVALLLPGWSDLKLLALPCSIASAILLLRATLTRAPRQPHEWVIVDGSNVMYWNDNTPKVQTVKDVVERLRGHGYTVGVMFDANAGYLLENQYIHDQRMGHMLGLPTDQIMVVPKGTPADPYILRAARDLGAEIVTNDRFRDWAADHPEVNDPGYLIRGGYKSGKLWLDLVEPEDLTAIDVA